MLFFFKANQQILIWNLNDSGSELQTTLPTHQVIYVLKLVN